MSEIQNSYKQVVKATSIFGGVQVFNILISIVRSKVIAIFLGPAGMGVAGLLNSVVNLVGVATNFGLETSAVKSISFENIDVDVAKVSKTVAVLQRLIWFTGILGTLVTIAFSGLLSQLTFGNSNYTFAFIWIAVTLLMKQLTSGQLAVLQAFRRLEYLAKANLLGSFFGLVFTIPLYYFWGVDAIVPGIILTSFFALLYTRYYSRKIKIEKVQVSNRETILEGKEMLKLGFSLSLMSLLTTLAAYILQIFISNTGGVSEVGLFNAGFAIINSYVGLIFTAMSTDYFPRLSAISADNSKIREIVKQQSYIAILIITPLIIGFLTFVPLIIPLLYSKEFTVIEKMISWGVLGMIFKAVSWAMGYILIAKGDSRMFIKTSVFSTILFLIINMLGYEFLGLDGLGLGFLVYYITYFFGLLLLTYNRYGFYFDAEFYGLFVICLVLCALAYLFSNIDNNYLKYGLMICIALVSMFYSFIQLDKKIDIKRLLEQKLKRKN